MCEGVKKWLQKRDKNRVFRHLGSPKKLTFTSFPNRLMSVTMSFTNF